MHFNGQWWKSKAAVVALEPLIAAKRVVKIFSTHMQQAPISAYIAHVSNVRLYLLERSHF
jgi:hypothetical protein